MILRYCLTIVVWIQIWLYLTPHDQHMVLSICLPASLASLSMATSTHVTSADRLPPGSTGASIHRLPRPGTSQAATALDAARATTTKATAEDAQQEDQRATKAADRCRQGLAAANEHS